MAGSVKLKDIADELNISIVTVSNALSGKKGVSETVRKKIIEKAQELGYDKIRYEEPVKAGTTIGVIVLNRYIEVGGSFYWAMYEQVAYAASRKQSFTMLEIIQSDSQDRMEPPRLLKESRVDGLIIIGKLEKNYLQRVLELARVPVVMMDFYSSEFVCDSIMSNNYIGMYRMTHYLLKNGHRDIAFVGKLEGDENQMDRYFGYRRAMEEWRISVNPDWILQDWELNSDRWKMRLPEKMPTAFACVSDLVASLLYDTLNKAGYRVPEDVSITGYDNYLYGHPFARELTTYNVDIQAMARLTVKTLMKKIAGDTGFSGVRYLDSYIEERNSVKTLKN